MKSWLTNRRKILLLAVASLGLLGYGAWSIYPPAGFLLVGALLWVELALWSRGK